MPARTLLVVNKSETGTTLDGPAIRAIRAALSDLMPSELRVAELVIADPRRVIRQSISELALEAGAAPSTVVRACRRLGFTGFQDLKLAIAQDTGSPITRLSDEIDEDSTPAEVLTTVLHDGEQALHQARRTLTTEAFADAVETISRAERVLFVAVGTSAPLAQDAAYRFVTIGVNADAPADVHVQHVRARLLTPRDVCVAISHTGATQETLSSLRGAQEAGAKSIAITSFVRSPLSDLVDTLLVAGSREMSYRVEAMSSRIAHLCVLDALFVAVALRHVDRAAETQALAARVISQHRF